MEFSFVFISNMGSSFSCYVHQGVLIESVAWDRSERGDSTNRRALLGSTSGFVYECRIDKATRAVNKVFDMNEAVPITGLEFIAFPGRVEPQKYLVILTTPTRLYQYIGAGHTFVEVFESYTTVSATGAMPNFREISPESPPPSMFPLQCPLKLIAASPTDTPREYAWLTMLGVFHGRLSLRASARPGDDCITEWQLSMIPSGPGGPPIALEATDYHFMLLFQGAACACVEFLG